MKRDLRARNPRIEAKRDLILGQDETSREERRKLVYGFDTKATLMDPITR